MRGTTKKHTFTIPFDTSLVQKIRVVYKQGGVVKIVKTEAEMEGNKISVKLSQEETLRLVHEELLRFQLRVRTKDNEVFKTRVFTKTVGECLDDEVL